MRRLDKADLLAEAYSAANGYAHTADAKEANAKKAQALVAIANSLGDETISV